MDVIRYKIQMMAEEAILNGSPFSWFEKVYAEAAGDPLAVPWANLAPNPLLLEWLQKNHRREEGIRALVIGCGLGDDAEELSRWGFKVTAFDISPSATEWCKQRFKHSTVEYRTVDLFDPPEDWKHSFELVFEAFTLQAMPEPLRRLAMERIAEYPKLYGKLLVVSRGRDLDQEVTGPPWPLIKTELGVFKKCGLKQIEMEDLADKEDPGIRLIRASYVVVDPRLAEDRKWSKTEEDPD